MNNVALLFLGFIAGIRHSMEADHIAAVTSIVSRHKKISSAVWAGGCWGMGHTASLMIVGFLILAFGLVVPQNIQMWIEILVGIALVVLGATNIKTGFLDELHLHKHKHDLSEHVHLHTHEEGKKPHEHQHSHAYFARAFVVGSIHGLAGSAALTLFILATIKSVFLGLLYIAIFGIGSIIGMATFGLLLGLPVVFANKSLKHINRYIALCGGLFSITVGVLFISEVGAKLLK